MRIICSFTGTIKTSTSIRHNQEATTNNHYDAPKFYSNNDDKSLNLKSNCLVTNGICENILVNEPTNNVIANDKVGIRSVHVAFLFFLSFSPSFSFCLRI